MPNLNSHERTGVYSVYEASSIVTGKTNGANVALLAVCTPTGEASPALHLYHYESARAVLQDSPQVLRLVELLLRNGASCVVLIPVKDTDYATACKTLESQENVGLVVCDALDDAVHSLIKTSVERTSQVQKERMAVFALPSETAATDAIAKAKALNAERVILLAPASLPEGESPAALAAAVAGAIAGERDPAVPMGGAELSGLHQFSHTYAESDLDALVRGGLTVVERKHGAVSIVRAVTTRTTTGGSPDSTWHELNTIRIIDDVIPTIRLALRQRFARAKNTKQIRQAIRAQVMMELQNKCRAEIISEYASVSAEALPDQPSICQVSFAFRVTHGLNQIWLSAKITV